MGTVFRAAIIGTGRIGSTFDEKAVKPDPSFFRGENRHTGVYSVLPVNHAGAYVSTTGYQLVAAANRTEEKLRAFGQKWGVKALYTDFRKLLHDEQPDVVSVCTQSPEKAEITIAAAQAGVKAIIVEKAMATSMAEADAMLDACERNGVFLAVNHPIPFSPIVREARALIDQGAIGRLSSVTAYTRGGMVHVGTHTFDLLRFWAGDAVEVEARIPDYVPDKDLPATGMVWFASGATGYFDHVHNAISGYQARGTLGYITTSGLVGDGWLCRGEPVNSEGPQPRPGGNLVMTPIEGEPHVMSTTQRLLTEVYQALTTGAPFRATGREGAAALELCLGCYASHMAGGPVKLPLTDRGLRVPNR